MTVYFAPCCHHPVDLPVEQACIAETIVVCPHCGAALSFAGDALELSETTFEGDFAELLAMLQDIQAHPGKYQGDESPGRALVEAPGVH